MSIENNFKSLVATDYSKAIKSCFQELANYIEELKFNPINSDIKNKISSCIYRWATLDEIKIALDNANLSNLQMTALTLKPGNIVYNAYDEWQKCDCTIVNEMINNIEEHADELVKNQEQGNTNTYQNNKSKNDYIR